MKTDAPTSIHAYLLYVGTGTGAPDGGIQVIRFSMQTGAFTQEHHYPDWLSPSYLALSPDQAHLYAIHQLPGQDSGAVSAFAVDAHSGALDWRNTQSTRGRGPCYVSVDTSGKWVAVANYSSGSVAVFPILADDSLGSASSVVQHRGSSVDPDRQEGPHAHTIRWGPDGLVYAADLGTDQVMRYAFDRAEGTLSPADPPALNIEPGLGPRHLDFHPTLPIIYVMNELIGSVSVFREGTLLQTISSVPDTFTGYNKSADIHLHPSGSFLYASNRGDYNSIAVFAVGEAGLLSPVQYLREGIAWPRNFAIDPSGQFLLVANRDSHSITSYRIDAKTGRLQATGQHIAIARPMCIQFGQELAAEKGG